jgi:hypothetical protein
MRRFRTRFGRPPRPVRRGAPLERCFNLLAKAARADRVAAVSGDSDLAQELSIELGLE